MSDRSKVHGHLEVATDTTFKNYTVVGIIVDDSSEVDRVTGNYIGDNTYRVTGRSAIYEVTPSNQD